MPKKQVIITDSDMDFTTEITFTEGGIKAASVTQHVVTQKGTGVAVYNHNRTIDLKDHRHIIALRDLLDGMLSEMGQLT